MINITYSSLHSQLMLESLAKRYFTANPSREGAETSGRRAEIGAGREALVRGRYEASLRDIASQLRGWLSAASFTEEGVSLTLIPDVEGKAADVEHFVRCYAVYDAMYGITGREYYLDRRAGAHWTLLSLLALR